MVTYVYQNQMVAQQILLNKCFTWLSDQNVTKPFLYYRIVTSYSYNMCTQSEPLLIRGVVCIEVNEMKEPVDIFLTKYVEEVTAILGDNVYGIYVYGSLALQAFQPTSDIDLLIVTKFDLTKQEVGNLRKLHKKLAKNEPLCKKIDGMYIPLIDLEKNEPCYYIHKGKVKYGEWDTNGITWWLLKHKGITLYGSLAQTLPIEATWDNVKATLQYNLYGYWQPKTKHLFYFWRTEDFLFAVTTMARIYASYLTDQIVSKKEALQLMKKQSPQQWHILFEEAQAALSGAKLTKIPNRMTRAKLCQQFLQDAITGRFGKAHAVT